MNKCWFVLEQSIFSPPEYTRPRRARGEANGPLRLGDIVPSPTDLYPIITQNAPLPTFPADMRIWDAPFGDFQWEASSGSGIDVSAGGGAPIATAAGITVDAGVRATFQKTMKSWANFEKMDIEFMQPSTSYIDQVLATDAVQAWINQYKEPITNKWSVFVVTGLMIARGGSVGHSDSKSRTLGTNAQTDISGVANAHFDISRSRDHENSLSLSLTTDRIWAIRFAKIHKGFLSSRWKQSEATVGATLDGEEEVEEKVEDVLVDEGLNQFETVTAGNEKEQVMFVIRNEPG
ncbi:hypothetical protein B0T10DRAFT_443307 [Thelonectria olida]|uniref:Uncharacterized protein n=1 Tax=Thelonectria olida TaxID=1576542 RepID=A0A9P9AR36_9HYPO|nr:hypothetical protein B0T10DRAFT_443307 [Thelonectria olida]